LGTVENMQRLPDLDVQGARPLLTRTPVVATVALAYVAILHYAYVERIAPIFTYLQYGYRTPDPLGYGIAIALVVGLAVLLPRRLTRPSHLIVWVLFVLAVVPCLVVPQIAVALSHAEALDLALWIGGCFLLVTLLGTRRVLRGFIPCAPLRPATFWFVIAFLFVCLNAYAITLVGVKLELPSLGDVYGVRDEFRQETSANPVLGYAVPLLYKVINPLMIVHGLWDRRWPWVAAGVLGQVYLYSQQGSRAAILSSLAIVGAFLVFRRPRTPSVGAALLVAPVVAVVVMIVDRLMSSEFLTSLLVRRLLVTPGLVTAGYIQVFDGIEKAQLGHSVLSSVVRSPYPYQIDPPDLVGALFFHRPETHANANWLADGYANFGYLGMVLASLVLVALLWAIDDATRGLPVGFACLAFLMPVNALSESAILTTLLNDGFVLAIVLCALAPRDGWARDSPVVGADAVRPPARPQERTTWQTTSSPDGQPIMLSVAGPPRAGTGAAPTGRFPRG
jgi:hypothetical protein